MASQHIQSRSECVKILSVVGQDDSMHHLRIVYLIRSRITELEDRGVWELLHRGNKLMYKAIGTILARG